MRSRVAKPHSCRGDLRQLGGEPQTSNPCQRTANGQVTGGSNKFTTVSRKGKYLLTTSKVSNITAVLTVIYTTTPALCVRESSSCTHASPTAHARPGPRSHRSGVPSHWPCARHPEQSCSRLRQRTGSPHLIGSGGKRRGENTVGLRARRRLSRQLAAFYGVDYSL